MLKTIATAIALAAMVSGGCRKPAPTADAPSGTPQNPLYQVTLDSGGSMKTSAAPVDVRVMSAGKPVSDAEVALEMRMPPTGAMGEMRTGSNLKSAGDGHYRGQVDLGMSGKWTAIVRVKRGGQLVTTYSQPVESVE
jgi:hypothetical protein